MAHHLEVDELEQGGGLEVYLGLSVSYEQHPIQKDHRRTHILAANLFAAFFQTVLDVLLLMSLVIPQASDEVVEGFLEPVLVSAPIVPRGIPVARGLFRTSCLHHEATTPLKP